ncbi:MAG TPA: hypothetical protein VL549_07130 [Gemmatimonadales bacterium]|nr:hypothetical protein [Gemmatimonadales bacterium]
MFVRVLSGVGAVLVFLVGLLMSLGAALGAPLGIWLMRRRARRRGRQAGGIALLFGGVLSSVVFAALVWTVVFTLLPNPSQKELRGAVAESQRRPVKMPDWYNKAFPQAAQADSASQRVMDSPQFMRMSIFILGAFLALFCGVIGGSAGWLADRLLGFARAAPLAS